MRKRQCPSLSLRRTAAGAAASSPAEPTPTVLHIDDDPKDAALLSAAAAQAGVGFLLVHIEDGEGAMAYLSGSGQFADRQRFPLPALILLDLKMPRADGLEVLQWIRNCPALRQTQVLVLSGSELQEDIRQAYAAGANSYLVKPIGFEALVSLVRKLSAFWLSGQPSGLPTPPPGHRAEDSGSSLSA